MGELSRCTRAFMINAEMITIPTLIKLFAIRIVARSRSGDLRDRIIIFDRLDFFSSRYERSEGESEKKATSEPEIMADPKSKMITHRRAAIMPGVNGLRVASIADRSTKKYGSVSKPGIKLVDKIRMGGRRLPQDVYHCREYPHYQLVPLLCQWSEEPVMKPAYQWRHYHQVFCRAFACYRQ